MAKTGTDFCVQQQSLVLLGFKKIRLARKQFTSAAAKDAEMLVRRRVTG